MSIPSPSFNILFLSSSVIILDKGPLTSLFSILNQPRPLLPLSFTISSNSSICDLDKISSVTNPFTNPLFSIADLINLISVFLKIFVKSLIVLFILRSGLSVPYVFIASSYVISINGISTSNSYTSVKSFFTIDSVISLTISGDPFDISKSS